MPMLNLSKAQRAALEPMAQACEDAVAAAIRAEVLGGPEERKAAAELMQRTKEDLHIKVAGVLGVTLEEMTRLAENPETVLPLNFLN